ncbi:hypothetical protein [Pelagibaculum spongiae]|uniref:SMI1/KNR4 family protein n=1 Tax=Pelagibaculum spongiae TaxID=2080658 RepID=A0A2V1GRZ4_9GAMM|nr:hypothetical protein [Pelagibaculum spongiae]PVZ64496.1 hypothetical protein DC094_19475 [Pelagibaculum spongiae]
MKSTFDIDALKPYAANIDIVHDYERISSIPDSWKEILNHAKNGKPDMVASYWKKIIPELSGVYEYFKDNLIDIQLVSVEKGEYKNYSLIYCLWSKDKDEVLYYEARNPAASLINDSLRPYIDYLPENLLSFYSFHDGWREVVTMAMGLEPLSEIHPLSDDDWGILDELENINIDLSRAFSFFSDATGDYLCIEFKPSEDHDSAHIWSAHNKPRENVNFWGYLDAWTVIGFE